MMAHDTNDIADALAHPDAQRERRVVDIVAAIAGVPHRRARALVDAVGGFGGLFVADEGAVVAHGFSRLAARRVAMMVRFAREYRVFHSLGNRNMIDHPESIWTLSLAWQWVESTQEEFRVASIASNNRLLGIDLVAVGAVDRVEVEPREVFRAGMRRNARAIILVHNHPSGDPMPSADDEALTSRMVAVGRIVGIPVVDHVVVAINGFKSMAMMGTVSFDAVDV